MLQVAIGFPAICKRHCEWFHLILKELVRSNIIIIIVQSIDWRNSLSRQVAGLDETILLVCCVLHISIYSYLCKNIQN